MSDRYRADLMALADRIDRHGEGEQGWETSPAHSWAEELRRIVADRDDGKSGWMAHIEQLEEVIRARRAEMSDAYRGLDRVTLERNRLRNRVAELEGQTSGYPTEDQLSPEMRRRLMPEGMKWPTVDGVPVRAGDTVCGYGLPEGAEVVAYTCGWPTSAIVVRPTRDLPPDGKRPLLQWWSEDCRLPAQRKESADSFAKAGNSGSEMKTRSCELETRSCENQAHRAGFSRADATPSQSCRDSVAPVDEGTGDKTNSPRDSSIAHADSWAKLEDDFAGLVLDADDAYETDGIGYRARSLVRRAKALAGEGR